MALPSSMSSIYPNVLSHLRIIRSNTRPEYTPFALDLASACVVILACSALYLRSSSSSSDESISESLSSESSSSVSALRSSRRRRYVDLKNAAASDISGSFVALFVGCGRDCVAVAVVDSVAGSFRVSSWSSLPVPMESSSSSSSSSAISLSLSDSTLSFSGSGVHNRRRLLLFGGSRAGDLAESEAVVVVIVVVSVSVVEAGPLPSCVAATS
mmetsp:Transcript_56126/g.135958  ORF Transcript_56126/g.135958 Transcript_56126/m.135958 type:complete len:213 (+) Transcript_56126:3451-4089(+)